ncbi:MAG: hypothetical protein ABDI07_08880 [Candidatus Kryptonium sp.]
MKVYNFVYTKVAPEESPWRKKDFHTVFYPIELLTREDLLEIERRIYFPTSTEFNEKKTVFYLKIKGEYYLFILHINNLPEARDIYGRGGIFLCHGFMFPETLWRDFNSPKDLFELVKNSVFKSREAVLSSPLVDKATGNISPIIIDLTDKYPVPSRSLPEINSEFEKQLIILLNNFARERKPAIVIKGEPDSIFELMNKLIAYIPQELKPNIGWDSAFDNGNLTFYPLKIVGFKEHLPLGDNPIYIDLLTQRIEITQELKWVFMPHTPYERWLYHCLKESKTYEHIEQAYRLSLILEGRKASGELLSERDGFVSCNREEIINGFLKSASKIIGEELANFISYNLKPGELLELLIEDLPLSKIALIIEKIVIKHNFTPKAIKFKFSEPLIKHASKRLKLILNLWQGEPISPSDLETLRREERIELIKYLISTAQLKKENLIEILKLNEDIFDTLFSSPEIGKEIEKLLFELIASQREFRGIENFLFERILNKKQVFAFLNNQINLMDVLEEFVKDNLMDEEKMNILISFAKKTKLLCKEYPYITSFLYPKKGVSEEILKNKKTRERLLFILAVYHKYKDDDLKELGFDEDEISKIKKRQRDKSLIEKIRKLIKFR